MAPRLAIVRSPTRRPRRLQPSCPTTTLPLRLTIPRIRLMIQRMRQTTLRLAQTMIARLRLKHLREAQLASRISREKWQTRPVEKRRPSRLRDSLTAARCRLYCPLKLTMERLARREQVLRHAKRIFARKGYHRTNIADIIARAHIARGTFYLYFRTSATSSRNCSSRRCASCAIGSSACESGRANRIPSSNCATTSSGC